MSCHPVSVINQTDAEIRTNAHVNVKYVDNESTVIPWLTSDPANEFLANEDFFRCFSDSANEYGFL